MSKFDVNVEEVPGSPGSDVINVYDDWGSSELMLVAVYGGERYPFSFAAEQVRELATVLAYWLSTREEPNG